MFKTDLVPLFSWEHVQIFHLGPTDEKKEVSVNPEGSAWGTILTPRTLVVPSDQHYRLSHAINTELILAL